MIQDLSQLTGIEWAVIALATVVCLLGSLLPMIGNLLGRLFLGEDPLLARWAQARLDRRRAQQAKAEARRERRARSHPGAPPA